MFNHSATKLSASFCLMFLLASCSSLQRRPPSADTNASPIVLDDVKDEKLPGVKAEASKPTTKTEPAVFAPKAVASNFALLAKSNRFDQMKDEATRNLAVNANDTAALNALALFYYKKNKLGASRIILDRILEKNPGYAPALTNLAVLDLAESEPAHALLNLKKSMKIDDRNPETLALVGSIYLKNKDYTKALSPLEQSYKNDKSNFQLANNYAVALTKNKSYDQAQKIYDEIMVQNSREPAILLNYAGLLVDYLNKPKEALNLVYKVKFIETENKDIIDLANKIEKKAKSTLK